MKLVFPHGESPDLPLRKGQYSIGNSSSDAIQLGDKLDMPLRGAIIVDQRGITLSIDQASEQPINVNNRVVHEKAILRLGDVLTIGELEMVLKSEEIDSGEGPLNFAAASSDGSPSRYHLRGINGSHSGQAFPLNGKVRISRQPDAHIQLSPDEELEVNVGMVDDNVILEVIAGEGDLQVNGYKVNRAILQAGDQITIGADRYLLESPAFVPGDAYTGERQVDAGSNTQVFKAVDAPDTPRPQPAEDLDLPPPKNDKMDPATKRDAIIIGVCVALSVMMLLWLYTNL